MKVLNSKELSIMLHDPDLALILGSIPVSEEDIKGFLGMPEWRIKIVAYEIGALCQYLLANKVGFVVKYGRCKTMKDTIDQGFRSLKKIRKLDRKIRYFPPSETEGPHQPV